VTWAVYKFGGSSLGGPGRLLRVVELVARGPRPLALVVSALGDTTDWLLSGAAAAAAGDEARVALELGRIRALASETARQALPEGALGGVSKAVEAVLGPLTQMLQGIRLTGECTANARDIVLSAGERIAAVVVTAALEAKGQPALAVDASTFVVTDNTAGAATVDVEATRERLAPLALGWGSAIPVVTGFIGRSREGRVTTLGRNGSDYTATVLAQTLGAREVTVWTDVPGVMTADPQLVSEAYSVPHLSYHEALELAHFGTRMFHPRTFLPLLESGAQLRIRNTADPEAAGTRIDGTGNADPRRPTCVTSLEHLALLGVESLRSALPEPIAARVLDVLERANVTVWMATQSAHGRSVALVVPAAEAARAHSVLEQTLGQELQRQEVELRSPLSPVSLVTLVAEAMGHRPNVAGRFFGALGNVGVNIRAIAQGASSRSISCVVDGTDTALAVRTVHAAFNLAATEASVLLLGRGTVGGRLLAQLEANGPVLKERHHIDLRLVGMVDRHVRIWEPKGLHPGELPPRASSPLEATSSPDVRPLLDALARLPVPILVDCTAADGMEQLYKEAFRRGVHVVAANKKPLALPFAERERLLHEARAHHRAYLYETTVGASLPIIETLKNLVRTGDRVQRIDGSLSGTLGFLSHELTSGELLSRAVRTARDRGYTEPHPRDDLSGLDVARKALILARELGLRLELEDVAVEPFVSKEALAEDDPEAFLSSLTALDAAFADKIEHYRASGKVLRYLVQIVPDAEDGRQVRVGPVAVEANHPATALNGAEALVAFTTERYHDYPLIVRGAGAGGDVTAAGVLADVLRLAQDIRGR
jgi:bifunctional aspartokinase / homoserine dehydrogenase 1